MYVCTYVNCRETQVRRPNQWKTDIPLVKTHQLLSKICENINSILRQSTYFRIFKYPQKDMRIIFEFYFEIERTSGVAENCRLKKCGHSMLLK